MSYDIGNIYDPFPGDTEEDKARLQQKRWEQQRAMRAAFPRLRDEIESEERDLDSVYNAARHNVAEAYTTLREGLDDHHADVRLTAADLIIDAYLTARQDVPQKIVKKLRDVASSDPDEQVRRAVRRYRQEPWAPENAS